jgi:hypothetical protein
VEKYTEKALCVALRKLYIFSFFVFLRLAKLLKYVSNEIKENVIWKEILPIESQRQKSL